jgi:hypothetical protein
MADRTSAGIFGTLFELLAKNPTEENKAIAREMYPHTFGYDFSLCQMGAEEALIKLGLAKKGINPDYPEDGETILYATQDLKNFEA